MNLNFITEKGSEIRSFQALLLGLQASPGPSREGPTWICIQNSKKNA